METALNCNNTWYVSLQLKYCTTQHFNDIESLYTCGWVCARALIYYQRMPCHSLKTLEKGINHLPKI